MDRLGIGKLLKNCSRSSMLEGGIQLHGLLVKMGFDSHLVVVNDLIDMYGKCGKLNMAGELFEKMPEQNVVSWTILIGSHVQHGNPKKALNIFYHMCSSETRPNEFTLSTIVKGCSIVGMVEYGMQIHGQCIKSGYEGYPVVCSSMIYLYAKSELIKEARQVFDRMPIRNLICWNAMIAGYSMRGQGSDALLLFREMQNIGEIPDEFSFASVLKACGCRGVICEGSQVHALLITNGLITSHNEILSGALIDFYVKSGSLPQARKVFDMALQRNVIMRTTLIMGYAQEGSLRESMDLFGSMWKSGVQIDGFALSSIIGVFADFAMVEQGKQLHSYLMKIPCRDISVGNSIIDLYIKCGLIEEAERKFREMTKRNVISWTVMINGYGKHGCGYDAICLFNEMRQQGFQPDGVTYLALLSACSHAGLIKECWNYFSIIQQENQKILKVEHYACMVDLLGRAGQLKEALSFIEKMSLKENIGVWQTLLSACRVHKDVEMGSQVGQILLSLDGNNPVNYVMLSNIYVEAGEWKGCEKLRKLMKRKGLKKQAGCSWIEIEKEAHFFYGGEYEHPSMERIQETLIEVERRMKEELGYNFDVRFAMHDVEEESKEDSLRFHSEKLAVGLGLAYSGLEREDAIRVYKNLRICGDCHEFMKGVSRVLKRTLVIRDANRFHRFDSGVCSCNDYWC